MPVFLLLLLFTFVSVLGFSWGGGFLCTAGGVQLPSPALGKWGGFRLSSPRAGKQRVANPRLIELEEPYKVMERTYKVI